MGRGIPKTVYGMLFVCATVAGAGREISIRLWGKRSVRSSRGECRGVRNRL